jgi:hypothetical protein
VLPCLLRAGRNELRIRLRQQFVPFQVRLLHAAGGSRGDADQSLGYIDIDIHNTLRDVAHGSLQEIIPMKDTAAGWMRVDLKWAKHYIADDDVFDQASANPALT